MPRTILTFEEAVDILLEEVHPFPPELKPDTAYLVSHDDTDGEDHGLSVTTEKMTADIFLQMTTEEFFADFRYRAPNGGGRFERVRRALLILAIAIRRDTEKSNGGE